MQTKVLYAKALLLAALSFGSAACSSSEQTQVTALSPTQKVTAFVDSNLVDAAAQYKVLMARLTQDRFPKTYHADKDELETSGSEWWTSGFYPGSLLYLYEETGDQALYDEAMRILGLLEKEQFNTSTHDLGFMMYDSFGNAHRIKPSPEYRQVLLNSAKSLASRFDPKVGAIRSWDSAPEDYIVIIDNMMNLDLLFWATKETGDSSYYDVAVTHANTTLQNHFRPDNSTYHVINYNPVTGEVQEKKTAQGAADESAWARGQAWGLYGFTDVYRETRDEKYLQQAEKLADFILNHPNLPKDMIPYWDYNAPGIPNALRDASAAAITASALLELSQYVDAPKGKAYFTAAESILKTLASEEYKAAPGTNGGFILKHGVGHKPAGTEVDVPLTYGDYYFIEGLMRYKALAGQEKI
ncbi:glycosyl hydrolase family 88 [Pontibacter ummariensis]|uniref:Glycosyl Hydrolase Family 88 n=1 Tax=Pontibacter ummariensis TaxID=1610492 RepID=A0A239GHL5_9BACT|nr:glycoside hydrolase family 88 protein [Pontibacter ummariensis]PRY11262.1 glycosyl hydrolase family 88 [Pontibacter ummariensis]SNS68375.1 Glycosyl Hydrolase Family 88 [Pontibacter ummariensis]